MTDPVLPEREAFEKALREFVFGTPTENLEENVERMLNLFDAALYAARPAPNGETGWLIECKHIGNAAWWDGKRGARDLIDCRYFTTDHLKAVRFARKEDAERIIEGSGSSCMQATEHMWVDDAVTYPAPDGISQETWDGMSANDRGQFLRYIAYSEGWKAATTHAPNDEARAALAELIDCEKTAGELRIVSGMRSNMDKSAMEDLKSAQDFLRTRWIKAWANARRVLGMESDESGPRDLRALGFKVRRRSIPKDE